MSKKRRVHERTTPHMPAINSTGVHLKTKHTKKKPTKKSAKHPESDKPTAMAEVSTRPIHSEKGKETIDTHPKKTFCI